MDNGCEALIGLVGAHGDAFELLEFAKEVFDQMSPFVHLGVDDERFGPAGMLRDDDLGATGIEIGNNGVAIEGLVGNRRVKLTPSDQWCDADRIEALSGKQHEAQEVAERVRQRQDFRRHAAFGAADGLARSPPYGMARPSSP